MVKLRNIFGAALATARSIGGAETMVIELAASIVMVISLDAGRSCHHVRFSSSRSTASQRRRLDGAFMLMPTSTPSFPITFTRLLAESHSSDTSYMKSNVTN
jgi:hypothetical protein